MSFHKSYFLNRKSFILISFLILGVGAWLFLSDYGVEQVENTIGNIKKLSPKNEPALITDSESFEEAKEESEGELYTNSQFGLSFTKPDGYDTREAEEGDSRIILIQSKDNQAKKGFQILITPLGQEEDVIITKSVIKTELPDLKIEKAKEISIGQAKGLKFQSDNPAFSGSSTEVWFMYRGNLYQISGYLEAMPIMEKVIKTWEFK